MDALKTTGERFQKEVDGEYYRSSSFLVTSQFGHLLELQDIDKYPENNGKNMWLPENLPFFPQHYAFEVKSDSKKRYNTIKKLLYSAEVDEVLHCGDPDREGQVLVDLFLGRLLRLNPSKTGIEFVFKDVKAKFKPTKGNGGTPWTF